jgi:hypothetical protein
MATPFLFPNMGRLAAAALFDGGSIVTVVSLVLTAIEGNREPCNRDCVRGSKVDDEP